VEIEDRSLLPEELGDIQEGTCLATNGEIYKGVHVFNAPIGDPEFVTEVIKDKAHKVCRVINDYATDLEEDHPQEMRTMLHYSLQHKITYWVRISTPEESEEMAEMVEGRLLKAAERATGVNLGTDKLAHRRLGIQARLKGGELKSLMELRHPTFFGAILDMLSR
jgi:hypothetical protein